MVHAGVVEPQRKGERKVAKRKGNSTKMAPKTIGGPLLANIDAGAGRYGRAGMTGREVKSSEIKTKNTSRSKRPQ